MRKKPITYLILGWTILILSNIFTDNINNILKHTLFTIGFLSIIYAFIVYYKK